MADEILRNSAALNALKRHQLVSLSKRYGLRASGKNVELIQRLEEYAVNHAEDLDFYIPSPAPTPGPNMLSQTPSSEPPTPTASRVFCPPSDSFPHALLPAALNHKESMMSVQSRASDAWEMLSESGASLISPKKKSGMTKSSSCSSWKSANNGEAMGEFGGHHNEKVSSTSSMKALATSLTRRGSRILLGRSTSASSHLSQAAEPCPEPQAEPEETEPVEEVVDTIPPSPASTIGIPRRHSRITLLERPSTVRLCSPIPTSPRFDPQSDKEEDELPFFDRQKLKERRSVGPLRSSLGSTTALSMQNSLSRKSMPVLPSVGSASIQSIYPPLPTIPPQFAKFTSPPPEAMPGAFPPLPPTPSQVVFGSNAESGVSNKQFSEAAQAVLREMNAKLPGGLAFGEELLKGQKAEVDKLVKTNKQLGTGGWGLSSSTGGNDRYAQAHQKEFANTHLIPSAPNGAPLIASTSDEEARQPKRSRLSNGPNYLGSLREAGRSIANLLGEEKGKSTEDAMKEMKARRDKRRSSLIKRKGRGLSSRFGFLRHKKASTHPSSSMDPVPLPATSVQSPPIPTPTMPRKTSVYAPRDPPHGRIPFDLEASLARKPTATRRRSTDLSNVIKPRPEVLENIRSLPAQVSSKSQKDRGRSTSAQTVISQSSSHTPRRAKIPDFAPPSTMGNAAMGSTNTLGLPKSSSVSSSLALSKKASQADIIRNARSAPPPPSSFTEIARATTTKNTARPASVNRSSTLYMPTASSLARMQATIKPNPDRPLPMLPPPVPATPRITTTVQPFGSAQSRDNQSFTSNFNLSKPPLAASKGISGLKPKTSQSAIGKPQSSAAARIRARQSGLSAVKSKGNLREDMEVKKKRSEIRARNERREEERELREMLGQ
uniref:SAP domain-containing protein n=1 Tax=Kwoniella dejecticola CBS 10117 TaxID=1296121 RepID=A0A1A5ZTW2_9TREE|nr:uncharacterized protein I303_08643 [Kwoniella dejecticola CBS 10117]OBR81257.1 hypothetical protein I303_08643 [Kwoniella dejecticola CBS 10117]